MAGQRAVQFVSIPLGPGVLSNTTPRGAKTRINYQNFDRWKDASWVRWHKLLPEKQLGWVFQSLVQLGVTPTPIPGSPVLLLHFDGADGATTTVDSSPFAWPVTFSPGNSTTPIGPSLTQSSPKFGPAALNVPDFDSFLSTCVSVPIVAGSVLDILPTAAWTIQGFFRIAASLTSGAVQLFSYSDLSSDPAAAPSLQLDLLPNSDGLTATLRMLTGGGAGWGGDQTPTVSLSAGVYHHFALVQDGTGVVLYYDGVAVGNKETAWLPSAYTGGVSGMTVNIGGNSAFAGIGSGFELDEFTVSPVAVYEGNFTPPLAASTYGLPNATSGADFPNGFFSATYQGLARGLKDWNSIDGQFWIAIGTNEKLYVVNTGVLYDITPIRQTSNTLNPFATQNGSPVVTVTDAGHKCNTGDFVDISQSSAVAGLNLNGDFEVNVIDPSTYTITAGSNATSTVAAGGGPTTLSYEISIGLPSNGQLLGYGTGEYGEGTYGTPRAAGSGVFARLRSWSLDNFGQDLIASYSDGEIYWWQKDQGAQTPAGLLLNAPTGCQRVIIDAAQRVIIALGCSDVDSTFESLLVRWCSLDDITDWFPTDINTAGTYELGNGSRIVTGIKTKGQNLIWTDIALYRMVFVGEPDIYDFIPAGRMSIVGPNAACDVDGQAYAMGFDNFYNYNGTLNLLPCDVWETVFNPNLPTSILKTQAEKVVCYSYETKSEITWLYPSIGGSGENDRYVTLNWEDGVWYAGAWNRTCAQGIAPAMNGFPYGVNAGFLYQHETGTDAIEKSGTVAIPFFMESGDLTIGGAKGEYTLGGSDARFLIGGSDAHIEAKSWIPDFAPNQFTGQMNLTIKTKERPQATNYRTYGPKVFDITTTQIDLEAEGSQFVLRFDNLTGTDGAPGLGVSFRMGIWQARSLPHSKR
jgi:Concanavalin A-like lectin/glucanases superfamily